MESPTATLARQVWRSNEPCTALFMDKLEDGRKAGLIYPVISEWFIVMIRYE